MQACRSGHKSDASSILFMTAFHYRMRTAIITGYTVEENRQPGYLMSEKSTLTREALINGDIERLLHKNRRGLKVMSDRQRAELVQQTLDHLDDNADLWIFAYGSLIWNPALDFEEQRRCVVYGLQKKFCFWTTISRGTEEQPGLMLGLVEGGQCNGLAYRIDRKKAATELDVLFRREMALFVYIPTWSEAYCEKTDTYFTTLTFVADPANERFVNHLTQAETARTIATATGPLGKNCDYLFQLSKNLRDLEFDEEELDALERQVREYQLRQ